MRKTTLVMICVFLFLGISLNIISADNNGERPLIEIYKVALESFLCDEINNTIYDVDYLSIDMSSEFFKELSNEEKKEIMDYFKIKYQIEVINESLDSLEKKGMVGKLWSLNNGHRKGMLIGIKKQDIDFNNKAVIEGYWYRSGIGARGAASTIVPENGQWKLQSRVWTWIS